LVAGLLLAKICLFHVKAHLVECYHQLLHSCLFDVQRLQRCRLSRVVVRRVEGYRVVAAVVAVSALLLGRIVCQELVWELLVLMFDKAEHHSRPSPQPCWKGKGLGAVSCCACGACLLFLRAVGVAEDRSLDAVLCQTLLQLPKRWQWQRKQLVCRSIVCRTGWSRVRADACTSILRRSIATTCNKEQQQPSKRTMVSNK
jgi:hypothetical protein